MAEEHETQQDKDDFADLDVGYVPDAILLGWNKDPCRRECPSCKQIAEHDRGPVFVGIEFDATETTRFICRRCAENRCGADSPEGKLAKGLLALFHLGETARGEPVHPAWAIRQFAQILIDYAAELGSLQEHR